MVYSFDGVILRSFVDLFLDSSRFGLGIVDRQAVGEMDVSCKAEPDG
jgi:hypothetical protein